MRSETLRKSTCWVLAHVFAVFTVLQVLPDRAQAAALSNLTPLKDCNDPLATATTQLVPNLMILIDTSGSMEETPSNLGLRTGADDPRSKMSILKRSLKKLINNNLGKINIGLATYNQETATDTVTGTTGNPVALQYDFDFLYAENPSTTTGNPTLITTDDPAADTTPANVIKDITTGQYYYDAGGTVGVYDAGTDYTLVGPFVPTANYATGLTNGNYGAYSYLWTLSTASIPTQVVSGAIVHPSANQNEDSSWHAHDTDVGATDTDNGALSLVGAFVNNDYWTSANGNPAFVDADPLATPTKHRIHALKPDGTVYPDDDTWYFDLAWKEYVAVGGTNPPGDTVATNPDPGKTTILDKMNPEIANLVNSVTFPPPISATISQPGGDHVLYGPATGLAPLQRTPLLDSMKCAFNFFNHMEAAGKTDWPCGSSVSFNLDPKTIFPTPPPSSCRKNYMLVITDGKDTPPPGGYPSGDPYGLPEIDGVMTGVGGNDGLIDLGVKTLIVGFSLSATGIQQVNRIAYDSDLDQVDLVVGGTVGVDDDHINDFNRYDPVTGAVTYGTPDDYSDPYIATNEATLVSQLEAAFGAITAGKFSTTTPILSTNVDIISGHSATLRYGNSPMRVNQNMLVTSYAELSNFAGHTLGFRLFDYAATPPPNIVIPSPPTTLWDAGNRTRSRSLILTSVANGGVLSVSEVMPDDVLPCAACTFPMNYGRLTDNNNMGEGVGKVLLFDNADWNVLIRWVRNSYGLETGPAVGRMGAPILGSPAVVGPPMVEPPPDADYAAFATAWKNRITMVYQPADDGMVHAIVGGLPATLTSPANTPIINWDDGHGAKDYYGGDELWTYIPHGILNDLAKFASNASNTYPPPDIPRFSLDPTTLIGQTATNHRFFMNGDVVQADVKIGSSWKTVIMGGYGPGHEGFWCLDVTNPESPSQLWDTDTKWSAADQETLGLTYSTPRIGKIRWDDGTSVTSKYVAFVGSGYHEGRSPAEVLTSLNRGRTFYVIDVADGTLLYKYTVDDMNVGTPDTNENKLVASTSTVDENFDGYVDDAYIGDLEGRVWKFAVDNSAGTVQPTNGDTYNGTDTPVPYFFDDDPVLQATQMTANGNPDANTGQLPQVARAAATMEYYSDGSTAEYAPLVFFGTGGDSCITPTAPQTDFVDGFIDPDLLGVISPKGKRFCSGSIPLFPLHAGESLVGSPVILGTKAYLTTFVPSSDPCARGRGYAYVIDFGTCLTALGFIAALPSTDITNLAGAPVGGGFGTELTSGGLAEGAPAGIAAGAGGVYILNESGSVTALQGGTTGNGGGPGGINAQQKVGASGQTWREEEH